MVEKFVSSLSVKAQNIVKKYMEQYEDLSLKYCIRMKQK